MKKFSHKIKWQQLFALLLSVALLSITGQVAHRVQADSLSAKEQEIRQNKAQVLKNLQAAKQHAESQAKDFESLKKEVEELEEKGKASEGEVAYLQGTFDKALQELQQAQQAYEHAVADMERQQKLYEDRLVAIFETRNDNNWLNILISSKNLQAFHTRYELSRIIADNDKQALDRLESSMDYAKLSKDNAEKIQSEADKLLQNAKKQLENLRNDISMREQNLLEQQNKLSQAQANIKNLEASSANYDAQLLQIGEERKKQAIEQAKRLAAMQSGAQQGGNNNFHNAPTPDGSDAGQAPPISGGGFVFPNAYSSSITCPFGYGDNVLSNSYFHRGVDFQAAFGSNVVAASGGTVTKAFNPYEGQNTSPGSYGNYIVIDHGGGLVTLYGHLKSVMVAEGQQVQPGQLIGLAGSTGNSTGPHLHFEVQVNGNLVNPMAYL